MNGFIIQDSLQVAKEVTVQSTVNNTAGTNWWMYVAILELGLISYLILKNRVKSKSSTKKQFRTESLKQDVDFNNIINSSFHSANLYDELKVKCHPDRFPTDLEKNAIAEILFQEISKSKLNAKRLLELKEEAKQKLNIHF